MRRPRGPGGRFLTADEVAEMERRKRDEEGSGGINGQAGVVKGKESDKVNPNNNANRTPNRPPHPMGTGSNGGSNTTPTGGSLKRKAGQAGLSSGTSGKKPKSGSGRIIPDMASESEDDGLADLVGDEDD